MEHPVILFDGVCNLCNSAVDFVIRRDRKGVFRYASLQSEVGMNLLRERGLPSDRLDTIVLVDAGGKVSFRSTAALKIARQLSGAWPLLYAFIILPAGLRDVVYNWIAANRYKWFGQRDTCRLPTSDERALFI